MWPDVVNLRDFYATTLGGMARRMIRRKVRELWPDVRGKTVAALGYSTPFLGHYREEARHLMVLMPAEQGALSWRRKTPNIVVLTEETTLPLADRSVDCLLVTHALEFTENPRGMMREVWRVLVEGGRLILIVPNRMGLWARVERTPFSFGHPYSLSQLHQFLRENMFEPLHTEHALYIPPSHSRIFLSMAGAWEKIGYRWFRHLSGVLIIEASKQMYAGSKVVAMPWRKQSVRATPASLRGTQRGSNPFKGSFRGVD